jgi:hypothetical protein
VFNFQKDRQKTCLFEMKRFSLKNTHFPHKKPLHMWINFVTLLKLNRMLVDEGAKQLNNKR